MLTYRYPRVGQFDALISYLLEMEDLNIFLLTYNITPTRVGHKFPVNVPLRTESGTRCDTPRLKPCLWFLCIHQH